MFKNLLLIFLLMGFAASASWAGVNLTNGNFFINYTDLVTTSQGANFKFERVYNSKSSHNGWFGVGWGTLFEAKVELAADGAIMVLENGSSGYGRFIPKTGIAKKQVDEAINKIVKAVMDKKTKEGKPVDQKTKDNLISSLQKNEIYRHSIAKQYGVVSKLDVGTKLVSEDVPGQEIEVTMTGFERTISNGVKQSFDKSGRLIKSRDLQSYGFDIVYKGDHPEMIKDTLGNQVLIKVGPSSGKIEEVKDIKGKVATYKYDSRKALIESKDIGNNTYRYNYDNIYNLTSIIDLNIKEKAKAELKIEYAPKTFNVSKVVARSGEVTNYFYQQEVGKAKGANLYRTFVIRDGKAEKYEYEYGIRTDGSLFPKRTLTMLGGKFDAKTFAYLGGDVEEYIYSERHNMPIESRIGKRVTKMQYTEDGFMKLKEEFEGGKLVDRLSMSYDPKIKKLVGIDGKNIKATYAYNSKGELEVGKTTDGRAIKLNYDFKGRISSMISVLERRGVASNAGGAARTNVSLNFEYNEEGKPSKIELKGLGHLVIGYTNSKVSSVKTIVDPAAKKENKNELDVSFTINNAFENLMEVVRPAGVSIDV
jgi:YD repeat-containing protein